MNRRLKQTLERLKGQFVALAGICMLMGLVMMFAVSQSFQRAADDLNTINAGSIPSVKSAQEMAQYLANIDAQAADFIATGGDLSDVKPWWVVGSKVNAGAQTVEKCDDLNNSAETELANKALFDAAHNVTYPGEQTAIERITAGFEEYTGAITEMRDQYALASHIDPHDVHIQGADLAYLSADHTLRVSIKQQPILDKAGNPVYNEATVPPCTVDSVTGTQTYQANNWVMGSLEQNIDCLNSINKLHLDQDYGDSESFLCGSTLLVEALCTFFCLLLAFTVVRLMWYSHRRINVVTLALIAGLVYSFVVAGQFFGMAAQCRKKDAFRHGAFQQVVKDDFDSVYDTAQLRRYATDANADESRWLIALTFGNQASATDLSRDWQDNTQRV